MPETDIQNEFVRSLENKIPKKTNLADFVAQTLHIEKETAYRRLRGDVQFSFREACLIAQKLNLSLDEIWMKSLTETRKAHLMRLPQHSNSEENGPELIQTTISFLEEFTAQPYSEFGVALSGLTFAIYQGYSSLARFQIFKYRYHGENPQIKTPFEKIKEAKLQVELRDHFYLLFRQISNTYYIWDRNIIRVFVDDINYFRSIRLINDEEVRELKKELLMLLEDLEQSAIQRRFKETGNKFELYISDVSIDVTYAYMWTEKLFVSMFSSFIFYVTASQEEENLKIVSDWIKSLKRCSTLVSGSAEKERFIFFEKQRDIVNTLG